MGNPSFLGCQFPFVVVREGGEGKGRRNTSEEVTHKAFQSIRPSKFVKSAAFKGMLSDTSSQSLGWRGKEADVVLQVLMAQVRKLRVRIFILVWGCVRSARSGEESGRSGGEEVAGNLFFGWG